MASVVSDAFPFLVWFVVAYPAIANLIPGASTKEPPER
jgi:hypothetical protein